MEVQNVDVLVIGRDGNIGPVHFNPGSDMTAEKCVHGFYTFDALILYQELVEHGFCSALVPFHF